MNPDTATLTEIRDWLARDEGWKWEAGESSSGVAFEIRLDYWLPPCEREWAWARDGKRTAHPFPLTLDGAAAAMPEGWRWFFRGDVDLWVWRAVRTHTGTATGLLQRLADPNACHVVEVPDTGNEIEDRYRLAAKARLAMESKT